MTTKSRIYNDGGYIFIDNELVKGWHKCSDGEFWAYQQDRGNQLEDKMATWVGPKIPADIMGLAFAAIAYKPDTEVDLCLYFSKTEGKWLIHLPKQIANGASVTYDDTEYKQPAGYIFQGTIHSHPNMSAFWSSVDYNDQKFKSGVHIVVGTTHGKYKEWLCSLWINSQAYDCSQAVELPDIEHLPELSKEWKDILDTPLVIEKPEPACTPALSPSKNDKYWEQWLDHYHYEELEDSEKPSWQKERDLDNAMLWDDASDRERLYDACWLLRDLGYEDIAEEVESSITADFERGYSSDVPVWDALSDSSELDGSLEPVEVTHD